MSYPILYLQTEEAKNLLSALYGTISDGYYENGPFYSNPKEDGVKKVKPCDLWYHPACPEGFTPTDISNLEIKVNEDYRLFGLWSNEKDSDLRKYGILDLMDLLVFERGEGRDKFGCRGWGSLWMIGVLIATKHPELGFNPEELAIKNHRELESSKIHEIYAKNIDYWDLMLMNTIREINEALRTSNSFSKDEKYGRLTHWKHYLSGGDCKRCNPWQRSYTDWDINETDIYESWMLENPYIENRD